MSKFTKKQSLFIEAAVPFVESGEVNPESVDKNQLQEIADVAEVGFPYWITRKNAGYKVGRGLFRIPVNGVAAVKETTTSKSKTTKVVEPVVDSTLSLAKGTVEKVSNVPEKDSLFVPQGHYKSVESVIKSKQFYPVFVTGLSGNGKTTGIEQACAAAGRECFRVNITKATDEDDLLGGFRLIDGETKFVYGPVVEAMKRGAVLLLDEIDLAGLGIMCLQSVLEGKGVFLKKTNEWITPAAGFTVFATANTKGKGSDDGRFIGTGAMNEAFLDRFPVTLEQEYAPRTTEKKIVRKAMKSLGCDDEAFAINLTKWADTIRKSFYEGAVDEIITTRRLIDIVKANAIFGDKMTAINMAVSRFDDETKEGFISLYTKIDAEVVMADESETPAEGGASSDCPFE